MVVRPNSTNIKLILSDDRIHIVEKEMSEYYTLADALTHIDTHGNAIKLSAGSNIK